MVSDYNPHAEYDEEADAIYVRLSDKEVARSVQLDDLRVIDYSADQAVVGIEFIGVGGGVDLEDIPHKPTVEKAINETGLGIRILV